MAPRISNTLPRSHVKPFSKCVITSAVVGAGGDAFFAELKMRVKRMRLWSTHDYEAKISLERKSHLPRYTQQPEDSVQSREMADKLFYALWNLGWQHHQNRLKRGSPSLPRYISSANTNGGKKYQPFMHFTAQLRSLVVSHLILGTFYFEEFMSLIALNWSDRARGTKYLNTLLLPTPKNW